MFGKFVNEIRCEACGGELYFDYSATTNDYQVLMSESNINVYDKIEDIINKHLVYKCYSCGHLHRYTYKHIEMIVRKKVTERVLLSMVRDQVPNIANITMEKFFIYCGKCLGIDGTGRCTKSVFNKCSIKRFPINGF
jgi:hypothetical protein